MNALARVFVSVWWSFKAFSNTKIFTLHTNTHYINVHFYIADQILCFSSMVIFLSYSVF